MNTTASLPTELENLIDLYVGVPAIIYTVQEYYPQYFLSDDSCSEFVTYIFIHEPYNLIVGKKDVRRQFKSRLPYNHRGKETRIQKSFAEQCDQAFRLRIGIIKSLDYIKHHELSSTRSNESH
jgi:hypothetical protein